MWMKHKFTLGYEKSFNPHIPREKYLPIRVSQEHIVRVTKICWDSEYSLDVLVELIEIDIGIKLARQIAEWDTFPRTHFETLNTI